MKYLDQVPIVGIIRGAGKIAVEGSASAAFRAGLRTIEITLNHPDAIKQIGRLRIGFGEGIELGAGTVLDAASAEKAIAAGAEFIVTPAFLPEVIEYCRSRSVPVFPGSMSPTEVLAAHRAGAEMVKVFPASVLGPAYIRGLKAPFPDIRLIPTGGITIESVPEYFEAGADALGVGGELFRKEWMNSGNWAAIEESAKAFIKAVEKAR
jgi:2-dehydro-3-deoxyphosphogluconate aldolase/(4S)-4-hydroxy-2-oxoglutarate aldolase